MSRRDCADWWAARCDRPLERSACVACPFQSRARWLETKRRWPELFAEAVEIDTNLRDGLAYVKEPYLHSRRMPLAQVVALDEAHLGAGGQAEGSGTSARDTVESEEHWKVVETHLSSTRAAGLWSGGTDTELIALSMLPCSLLQLYNGLGVSMSLSNGRVRVSAASLGERCLPLDPLSST